MLFVSGPKTNSHLAEAFMVTKNSAAYWFGARLSCAVAIECHSSTDVGDMTRQYMTHWLVLWNMFYFPVYWEESSQLTFIFFRGVGTTNQLRCLKDFDSVAFFYGGKS